MSWLGSIFGSIPTTADNPQDDSTLAPPPPPQSSQPPVDNTVKVAILLDGDADYVTLHFPIIDSKREVLTSFSQS